jgi:hypothetical protein
VYPLSGSGDAYLQYTVYPNFGVNPRQSEIRVNSAAATVSQAAGAGTYNERFAGLMYFNFFGRLAGPGEIALQAGRLNTGGAPGALVNDFFQTLEFNLGGRFIAGLYVGLLARDAEFSGWLFQRNAMARGIVSPNQLVQNFLNSDEYRLKFGSPNDREYVRLLYRNVLLREASEGEVDGQVAALPGIGRVQLANNFLNSGEFRVGTGPRLTAFILHTCILMRDPSVTELNQFMSDIAAGVPVRTLIDRLLGTGEFASLVR